MTQITKRIQSFWGTQLEPVLLPPHLNPLISKDTQVYLENVGLPHDECLELERSLNLRFIPIPGDFRVVTIDTSEYIVVGERVWQGVLLSDTGIKAKTGEFYFLYNSRNYFEVEFVNSNIECFLAYAAVWLTFRSDMDANFQLLSGQANEMYSEAVITNAKGKLVSDLNALRNEFMDIDPKALDTKAERFWVPTFGELEDTVSYYVNKRVTP